MPMINIITPAGKRSELSLPLGVMTPRAVLVAARQAGIMDFVISADSFVVHHIAAAGNGWSYRGIARMPIINGDEYRLSL